jgi:hypothetical protein
LEDKTDNQKSFIIDITSLDVNNAIILGHVPDFAGLNSLPDNMIVQKFAFVTCFVCHVYLEAIGYILSAQTIVNTLNSHTFLWQ